MLRRGERAVIGAAVVAIALVALAGALLSPTTDLDDPRLSADLAGPNGAKGLAQTLRRLGVQVERRRRPYFDIADSSDPGARPTRLLAFLGASPDVRESAALLDYVGQGGRILSAGRTGIESCFGYRVRRRDVQPPLPRAVLVPMLAESLAHARRAGVDSGYCPPRVATAVDTLWRTAGNEAVAVRLSWPAGGEATLVADGRLFSNRSLKETDAGVRVVPWLLRGGTRRVVFDEYHLGFGTGGSLAGASWDWLLSHPIGWAILQLAGVAIIALAVQAMRFGPARAVRDKRRRSSLEHVDALAAALEAAGGVETAVQLTVNGLRRRLSPGGRVGPRVDREWLEALALGITTPRGRATVERLEHLVSEPGGAERLLAAAQAVEDVWEELRPRTTRDKF